MKVFKPLTYDEMKAALQDWLSLKVKMKDQSIRTCSFDSDIKESNYSLDTITS